VSWAQSLKPETTYGNDLGCAADDVRLESDSWQRLTLQRLEAHETNCEFAELRLTASGSIFASAICYAEGYAAPEIFSITPSWDDVRSFVVTPAGNADIHAPSGVFKECAE
jgi:hypothetical protein